MPYTPPSRSPVSSVTTSPNASRRPSIHHTSRPSLPHSASYLSKHRRSPSISSLHSDATVDQAKPLPGTPLPSTSLRQSPPPLTRAGPIPSGAIISPPESSSGSDDEFKTANSEDSLKTLREAVSQISQTTPLSSDQGPPQEACKSTMRISISTTSLPQYTSTTTRSTSHNRSATEPHPALTISTDNSATMSSESDDDSRGKPQMVRKKSGELVRPALRPASRRRPMSMPGTPVYSKAVHFDSHLEHVRHFLQVDRPLAVSAGSSPVEAYESDIEYPFLDASKSRKPPFEWELTTTNFPHDNTIIRQSLPARLEKVWLSKDQKSLHASIRVANLAFEKQVTCRFTLDGWKTTSEVSGQYSCPIDSRDGTIGYDRFTVSIQLADTANLECKTLYFCIRYHVNGREYWDNNNGVNFQVDFTKKYLPQRGKGQFQGTGGTPFNGLPRSNRKPGHATTPRPVSMPSSLDDFADETGFRFDQSLHEYLGEAPSTGLRFKSKSFQHLASDNIDKSLPTPSGAAFANRYDFGASLDAAKSRKDDSPSDADALYMRDSVRTTSSPSSLVSAQNSIVAAPGTAHASSSYEELVNKYCFFGMKPSSPQIVPPMSTSSNKAESVDEEVIVTNYQMAKPACSVKSAGPTASTVEHATPKPPSQRSISPTFATVTGTLPVDVAFHTQQAPDRFVPATAIRG